MDILRFYTPLILLIAITEVTGYENNATSSNEERQSRATGRIDKLYSGPKPEPILCAGEGFQKDPYNCAVFYRCMKSGHGKYTVFRFQCGPGTVYDPDTEVCNHPRSTKRSECGGILQPTEHTTHINEIDNIHQEIPSPIITNRPIYIASASTARPSTGPTHSTTKREVSTPSSSPYPWGSQMSNVFIDNGTAYPLKPITVTTSPVTLTHGTFTTIPGTASNNQHLDSRDNICTSDGFMGDSENCRKFYRCVANHRGGYTRFEFSCTETTVWDEDNQICNHIWAVKRSRCGRGIDKITSTNTISTTEKVYYQANDIKQSFGDKSNSTHQHQLQVGYGSKVTQTQTQMISGPVVQNHTQIHYGDRISPDKNNKNHQTQTQVSQGYAVSQTQAQIDYGHREVQTQLQIDQSSKASQSQTQTLTSTERINSGISNVQGNNECTKSGFMGDSNDCQKFYRCIENGQGGYTKYQFTCGEGTVWDQDIQACNHAWAVKGCGSNTSSKPSTSTYTTSTSKTTSSQQTTSTKTTTTEKIEMLPDSEDNEDNGYQNPVPMPTSTTTSTSTLSTPLNNSKKEGKCTSSGFMGDDNDCKIFYRCVENGSGGYVKYEFKCGEGTVWDPKIQACNHAWAVEKCGGSSSPDVTKIETTTNKLSTSSSVYQSSTHSTTSIENYPTASSSIDTADDDDNGYQKPQQVPSSSSTSTPISSTTISGSKGGQCTTSGFMGDANDCKIFYRCVENGNGGYVKYEFKCGEGTVWDPEIEACNHAWAVEKCGGSSSPDVTKIETTTSKLSTSSSVYQSSTHLTTSIENYPTVSSSIDAADDDDNGYQKPQQVPSSSSTSTPISLTTISGSKGGQCTTSGFMGDANDCKIFYRCVENGNGDYVKYEFKCGEGTVWDPEIEACNHAWAVATCGSNTASTSGITTEYYPPINDELDNGYPSNTNTDTDISIPLHTTLPTTETSKESDHSSSCMSTGFIGDKNDCKKFYRCVDNGNGGFIRYEFNCGEGTVWDQSIEACNHAWAVKECGSVSNNTTETPYMSTTTTTVTAVTSINQEHSQGTSKPVQETNQVCSAEGFMSNSNNCKIFYRCVDDGKGGFIKYEFSCGEGTYWDQEALACDHITSDDECGKKGSSTTSKVPQYEHDETYTEGTTSPKDDVLSTQKPPSSSETCIAEGFYGDQNDCKKFYRCVDNGQGGYTKYDFTCGDGTVWDQDLQTCNHELNKCSSMSSTQTTSGHSPHGDSTTMQTTTDKKDSSSSTSTPTTNMQKCESEGFFADPNDCRKFIRCVKDDKGRFTKYEFTCAEGTVWVQEMLACDHDTGETLCSTQIATTQANSAPITESTTNNVLDEQDEKHNNSNTEPSSENNNCLSEGYYGNKDDCRKFYRCVDNGNGGYTKYDFTCSDGTAWDIDIQACNHIDQVSSCQGTALHDEDNTPTTQSTSTSSQDSSSTITSTTQETTGGPAPNSESTTQNSQKTETCENEGFFGNTQDCKKFYRCVDNGKGGYTKYDFTCAEGTIWDQDLTTCNHPGDVVNPSCNSIDGGSMTEGSPSDNLSSGGSSTEGSSSGASSSGESSSSTEGTSETQNQEGTSKKPDNNNVNCTKAGFYPNPNDCKKFYRCVDWDGDGTKFSVFHFECGEGTIWDPAVETCNHEESVYPPRDCSGSQSQGENQSPTTESTTTTAGETESETSTTKNTEQPSITTESTTSTTTEQTEEGTTTKPQESTTEPFEENTTKSPGENTTEQSTESTTEKHEESTTEKQGAITTEQQGESTTEKQEQSTTEKQEQSTTEKQGESTTEKQEESTTEKQEENTTEKQGESTTEKQEEITTEKQGESTTEGQGESTTEKSSESTTEPSDEGTTEKSTEGTSTQTTESTTEQSTEKTTEQTSQSTTEQTVSTTQGSTEQTTTEESSSEKSTTEQSTTEQASTTESGTETSTNKNSGTQECPETEEDQYLFVCPSSFKRHPKYCNLFYQCDENEETHDLKIAVFTCPNGTIYDESKIKCVEESKAEKQCDGEIAQRLRVKRRNRKEEHDPIVVGKDSYACPAAGFYALEKDGDCSPGFLKCTRNKTNKLRGMVYQCPEGYIFWSVSRRCERMDRVRDCRRSVLNSWNKRWEIPVERRNVAWS